MKPIRSTILLAGLLTTGVIGALVAIEPPLPTILAIASTSDALQQHQQNVLASCFSATELRTPQTASQVITFGDDVGYDALLVRGTFPQPHMNNQTGQFLCLFDRRTRQAHANEVSLLFSYSSAQYGFQFSYPFGYVAEVKSPEQTGDRNLEWIDIWTQRDYDGIHSGEVHTELPPNVSVAIQHKPQQLSLHSWVRQNNQFALPKNFDSLTIAGQRAISFQSTGLYEYEQVVIQHPDNANVIVIRLGTVGVPESDQQYHSAFEQILSSFQFTAQ